MIERYLRLRLWVFFSAVAPDLLGVRPPLTGLLIIFEPLLGVFGVVGGAIFRME